ncbi:MAG: DUF11 domain-containing protein [Candidatus Saccharibacteria bacterium]
MGKLFTIMRSAPKRTSAVLAMIAAAVIVPAALLAYGPARPTYTIEHPADHVTFNSITNNPNIGDERNFVGIRETGTNNLWSDDMTVEKGKEYTVRVYVHNNAASDLNKVAEDVTARINLPTNTAKSIQVDGMISSSNATPKDVWDDAVFNSDKDFNLAYTSGSLKFENNAFGAAGTAIPESVFTNTGALLGYDKLDGKIPGCFQYAGYLSFNVKPQFAPTTDFTVKKDVRKLGDTTWSDSVNVKPGDSVEYLVSYKNTGEIKQDNVTVKDALPAGVSYVPGTTKLKNGLNPNGKALTDGVTTTGVNVSNYNPGAAAYVWFTAKVGDKTATECGLETLVNTAKVETDYGNKSDTANVVVDNGACKPGECKPGIPVGDTRCVETPVTPSSLPTTGPTETILSVIGLGALIASIGYYVNSRRAIIGR